MKFTMNFELMPSSRTILLMAASVVTSQGMVHGGLNNLDKVEIIRPPKIVVSADNTMISDEKEDLLVSPPEKGVCVKDACEEKPKQGTDTDHEAQTEATNPVAKSSLKRLRDSEGKEPNVVSKNATCGTPDEPVKHVSKKSTPAKRKRTSSRNQQGRKSKYYPNKKAYNELGLKDTNLSNDTMNTKEGWLCTECQKRNDYPKWNPYSVTENNTYYHKDLKCFYCGEESDLLNRAIREECAQFRKDVENLSKNAIKPVCNKLDVEAWVVAFKSAAKNADDEQKSRLKDDFLFWSMYDVFARGATEEQILELKTELMLEDYRYANDDDRKRLDQRIQFLIKFNKYMETATPNVKSKIAEFARRHEKETDNVERMFDHVITNQKYKEFFQQFVTCGGPCVATCGVFKVVSSLASCCGVQDVWEQNIGGCFERNPWLVAICRCTCSATEDAGSLFDCCVAMADCLNECCKECAECCKECAECCADCDCDCEA